MFKIKLNNRKPKIRSKNKSIRKQIKSKHTEETIKLKIYENHNNSITLESPYKYVHTKSTFKCNKGHTWETKLSHVLAGSTCRICRNLEYNKKQTKTHDEYCKQVKLRSNNCITVVGKYINAETPLMHKCSCGECWLAYPGNILKYSPKCPFCRYLVTNKYKYKKYQLNNKIVRVQGYEPIFLDYMINILGIKPKYINVSTNGSVPYIKYKFGRQIKHHFPDIYDTNSKIIYEVKSTYTFGYNKRKIYYKNKAKCKAAAEQDITYRMVIVHKNKCFILNKDWYKTKASAMLVLKQHNIL